MNYFFDTEFLEGTQPKKFLGIRYGETKPTIDLISIGIVDEEGNEFYAISKDFNLDDAWNRFDIKNGKKVYWIRENVLLKIHQELTAPQGKGSYPFTKESMAILLKDNGKTKDEIQIGIRHFVYDRYLDGVGATSEDYFLNMVFKEETIKFWAYYASYDWVVFCQLFGKMIDLPKGFPMYCMDLKNLMEFKGLTKKWKQENCPEPKNAHSAIVDARWNKVLFNKIKELN